MTGSLVEAISIIGQQAHGRMLDRKRERAALMMMTLEGMQSLTFEELCNVIESYVQDRNDVCPGRLEELGNKLNQHAWEVSRNG